MYSHSDTIAPTPNSLQKLDYIYQHFQDNEKKYESDPNLVSSETDNTLYPHINNDIEYGLFEDVIDSYYLDHANIMDASLFTMDTTTPCDYNISSDILNSDKPQEIKTINNKFIINNKFYVRSKLLHKNTTQTTRLNLNTMHTCL